MWRWLAVAMIVGVMLLTAAAPQDRIETSLQRLSQDDYGRQVVTWARASRVTIDYTVLGHAGQYRPSTRTITLHWATQWPELWSDSEFDALLWHELYHVVQLDNCPNVRDPWLHHNSALLDRTMQVQFGWRKYSWLSLPILALWRYEQEVVASGRTWNWTTCTLQ